MLGDVGDDDTFTTSSSSGMRDTRPQSEEPHDRISKSKYSDSISLQLNLEVPRVVLINKQVSMM